jgi:hypothetical protein
VDHQAKRRKQKEKTKVRRRKKTSGIFPLCHHDNWIISIIARNSLHKKSKWKPPSYIKKREEIDPTSLRPRNRNVCHSISTALLHRIIDIVDYAILPKSDYIAALVLLNSICW